MTGTIVVTPLGPDTDGDGVYDVDDLDDDNDGITDLLEGGDDLDTDLDGLENRIDPCIQTLCNIFIKKINVYHFN